MSRASALEFSFFPVDSYDGSGDLLRLVEIAAGKGENAIGVTHIDAHGWLFLAMGLWFRSSWCKRRCVVLAWVRKHGLRPFAIYRIIVAARC